MTLGRWLTKPQQGVPINRSHPLATGLLGCWLFNEGGGNRVADLSGNNNTGILTGMAIPSTATAGWNPSKNGVGLAFDGSTGYVLVPSIRGCSAITISTWVRWAGGGSEDEIWSGWGTKDFQLNAGKFRVYFGAWIESSVTLNTVSWYHLVATVSSAKARLYVNGVQNVEDNALSIEGTSISRIGQYVLNLLYGFPGLIDNTCIWNRALSSQEVMDLYINPYGMFEFAPRYLGRVSVGYGIASGLTGRTFIRSTGPG